MSYSVQSSFSFGDDDADDDLLDPPSRIGADAADEREDSRTDADEPAIMQQATARGASLRGLDIPSGVIDVGVEEDADRDSPTHSHPAVSPMQTALSDAAILADEEDYIRVVDITNYVFDWPREIAYWTLALLTGFLSCLLGYWFPRVMRRHRYLAVPSPIAAEYVSITTVDGGCDFLPVEPIRLHSLAYAPHTFGFGWYGPTGVPQTVAPDQRMVVFRHHRFFLDATTDQWVKQHEPLQEPSGVLTARLQAGLSLEEHAQRQRLFGINQLQILVPTYPVLLMQELFHPFFIFQIYSVILWCFEAYYSQSLRRKTSERSIGLSDGVGC